MIDRSQRTQRPLGAWAVLSLAVLAALTMSLSGSRVLAEDATPKPEREKRVIVVKSDGEEAPHVQVYSVEDEGEDGDDVQAQHKRGGYLGVSIDDAAEGSDGGAHVETVVSGSPAEHAGIKRGDTIVSFDGHAVRGPAGLTEMIHAAHPGDQVEIKLIRKDGKKDTISVELEGRPKVRAYAYGYGDGEAPTAIPDLENLGESLKKLRINVAPHAWRWRFSGERPKLGVELVETTPELREHLGGVRDAGVLVGKVLAGTPAQKSGVKVGDLIVSVDGGRVKDADDLIEVLSEKSGKTVDLEVVRDRKPQHVQVAIPADEDEEGDEPRGPRAFVVPVPPPPPPMPPDVPAVAPPPPPRPAAWLFSAHVI